MINLIICTVINWISFLLCIFINYFHLWFHKKNNIMRIFLILIKMRWPGLLTALGPSFSYVTTPLIEVQMYNDIYWPPTE